MTWHTPRMLGAAIGLAAILLAGVTAAFASGSSPPGFVARMMGGTGHGGMMQGTSPGGMMNGSGTGGMMGGSSSMMGGWGQASTSGATISLTQARREAQRYINTLGNRSLAIDEVIEFQRNFYVSVKDTSTGHGAFELLVNKVSGAVGLEPGPGMMWNTEYGMMRGGMMGYQQPSGPMTVSVSQVAQVAAQWLQQHESGATAEAPDQFPGYYTIHFLQNGAIAGMLSVNGYTGRVWYHTWHGAAVR